MEINFDDLDWFWFKGSEVVGSRLQDVCLFRSHILYDSGFRTNFGSLGQNFGDVQFSDFGSYHIVVAHKDEILGTARITPPEVSNLTLNILGLEGYKNLLSSMSTCVDDIVEIGRFSVDRRVRCLGVGRSLVYATIGLIENIWNRSEMTVISSAGNCQHQAQFFLNHTDHERIPGVDNMFSQTFNDEITFLKYGQAPYTKGADKIAYFKDLFKQKTIIPFANFKMGYKTWSLADEMKFVEGSTKELKLEKEITV